MKIITIIPMFLISLCQISCTTETSLSGCPDNITTVGSYAEDFENAFVDLSRIPPSLTSSSITNTANTNADFENHIDAIEVISDGILARSGNQLVRFIVYPDDNYSGNRSELSLRKQVTPACSEAYYAWSFRLDDNFEETGNFNTVGSWHSQQSSSGEPAITSGPFFQEYLDGSLYVATRHEPDYRAVRQEASGFSINPDEWVDIIYHIKWSPFANDGYVEAWIRNVPDTSNPPPYQRFFNKIFLRTIFNDTGNYFKFGLYRSLSNDPSDIANRTTGVVYYDEVKIGGSLSEVSLGTPPIE